MRQLKPQKRIEHYGPLKNLTTVLYYASITALSSAVAQVTLGLVGIPVAALICLIAAVVSIGLLFWAMILVKLNLNVWLQDLETRRNERQN